jgi:hypothetical protein
LQDGLDFWAALTVFGSGNYDFFIPEQTYGGGPRVSANSLSCVEYVNQTMAVQSDYTNVAAWGLAA